MYDCIYSLYQLMSYIIKSSLLIVGWNELNQSAAHKEESKSKYVVCFGSDNEGHMISV